MVVHYKPTIYNMKSFEMNHASKTIIFFIADDNLVFNIALMANTSMYRFLNFHDVMALEKKCIPFNFLCHFKQKDVEITRAKMSACRRKKKKHI